MYRTASTTRRVSEDTMDTELITLQRQQSHFRSTGILQCYVSVMDRAKYTFIGMWLVMVTLCTWLSISFIRESQISLFQAPPNTDAAAAFAAAQQIAEIRDSRMSLIIFEPVDPQGSPVDFRTDLKFRDFDQGIEYYMRTGNLTFTADSIPALPYEPNVAEAFKGLDAVTNYDSYPSRTRYEVSNPLALNEFLSASGDKAYATVSVNTTKSSITANISGCNFLTQRLPEVLSIIKSKFDPNDLKIKVSTLTLCSFDQAVVEEFLEDSIGLSISLGVAFLIAAFAFALRTDSVILGCVAAFALYIINAMTFGVVYLLQFVTEMQSTTIIIGLILSLLTSVTLTYLIVVQIQDVQQAVLRYGGVLAMRDQAFLVLELVLQGEGRAMFYSAFVLILTALGFLIYVRDELSHIRCIPITALVLCTFSLLVGVNLLPCVFLAFPSMFARRGLVKSICCCCALGRANRHRENSQSTTGRSDALRGLKNAPDRSDGFRCKGYFFFFFF